MKPFLSVLCCLLSASAWAQPIIRNYFTTNATPIVYETNTEGYVQIVNGYSTNQTSTNANFVGINSPAIQATNATAANGVIAQLGMVTVSNSAAGVTRVGIGKANPTVALDVVGSGTFSSSIQNSGQWLDANGRSIVDARNSTLLLANSSDFTGVALYGGSANAERMRVADSGYVGIATTNPTTELTVNGTLSASNGVVIDMKPASGNQLPFWLGSNGTAKVIVNTNGNVGIGTLNPGNTLSVAGSVGASYFAGRVVASTIDCNGPILFDAGGYSETTNRSCLKHFAANTNLIVLCDANSGASGAGLVFNAMYFDPTPYESTTNTVVRSQGTNFVIGDTVTAPGFLTSGSVSASNGIVIDMQQSSGNQLPFWVGSNGTAKVVINTNGWMAVGKQTPGVMFDISGSANADGEVRGNADVVTGGSGAFGVAGRVYLASPVGGLLTGWDYSAGGNFLTQTNGIALLLKGSYNDFTAHENGTNTLIQSKGTYLGISDPILAPGYFTMSNLPPVAAPTIGATFIWNSNGLAEYKLWSSATGTAWTKTNVWATP